MNWIKVHDSLKLTIINGFNNLYKFRPIQIHLACTTFHYALKAVGLKSDYNRELQLKIRTNL